MIGLYLALGAFVAGLAMGGYAIHDWDSSRQAAHERDLAEAQEKVDELAQQAQVAATQSLENERIAYASGEANAQTITKVVYQKAQTYANAPAMHNPACVVGDAGMLILAAARSGTLSPADASRIDAAVRGTGTAAGRADGDPVPANDSGRGTVPAVQPQASSPVGGGQVSGTGSGRVHPKPQAIH